VNQIGTVIRSILADDAGVGALIGNKIYSAPAPQEVRPSFATYSVVSNEPYDTKSGASDLDRFRVQIDSWAKNASDAASISAAIRTALDRYTPGLVESIRVDGIRYETERTDYDTDTDLALKSQDFFIRIKY
jgi:Zn-dependent M28 family amino/carboxypeptidase